MSEDPRFKIVRNEFKNHVATYSKCEDGAGAVIERMHWQKPDTGINSITYLFHGHYLMAIGDLGDAVYRMHGRNHMVYFNSLSHFQEKCEASEVGREFNDWCSNAAEEQIEKYFVEAEKELPEEGSKIRTEFNDRMGGYATESREGWATWLYDSDNGEVVFGDDFWEFAYQFGDIPHIRLLYHYEGLRMAFLQLAEKEKANEHVAKKQIR